VGATTLPIRIDAGTAKSGNPRIGRGNHRDPPLARLLLLQPHWIRL